MKTFLQHKHILITGGCGTIGQAIAWKAKETGATITLWDTKTVSLADYNVQNVDTTDEIAVQEGFANLESMPDIIINCAGIFKNFKPLAALELNEFNELHHMNTTSCFLVCREGLRHYKGNLTIINISSALSAKAIPLASAYCASKAGIDSLTRSIAAEYGTQGVLAVSLNPGPVAGSMLDNGIDEIATLMGAPREAVIQQMLDVIPSGKLVDVEEIAAMAVFIATGQTSSMQGKQINI
ncbi:MAG: SDR family NAD(P)-dependent oxidoreductase, partial [Spirochaetales bacterium]|nr:SDR family NAD(P)-dependent oxidoreductase [Spirochaetales bacterium]